MGNTIFIKDKSVCIKALRNRLEAIQKVNFLSMFCPKLQKLLKPIFDLTRKGRQFVWRKEKQDSFEEIKCRLIKPPVLHMPNTTGRFPLY